MRPKIIGIVGPIRSGKSFAARYITRRYGYKNGSNSEVLRQIATHLDMPNTRDNLRKLGDSIFKVLGNDAIARYRLQSVQDWPLVVEGIRYIEEVSAYKIESSFKLLGLKAKVDLRYARALALLHEGKDEKLDRETFNRLGQTRSELQVDHLVETADFIIHNDSSITAFEKELDRMMTTWCQSAS